MSARLLSAFLVLGAALVAQVPSNYVVVAETTAGGIPLTFVEPSTRLATPTRRPATIKDGAYSMVAVDPAALDHVFAGTQIQTSVVPTVLDLTARGNETTTRAVIQLKGVAGGIVRALVIGPKIFVTVPAGSAPGVYEGQKCGCGTMTLLAPLARAYDLAERNGKLYVASYLVNTNSTLIEVDLATSAVRTIGTSYAGLRSIGFLGNTLIGGNDAGELRSIDITTGNSTLLQATGKGPILSIANAPNTAPFCYCTVSDVYMFPVVTPIYTATGTNKINDIDIGVDPNAALLLFGDACAGKGGALAQFQHAGAPKLGDPAFTFLLAGANASLPGILSIGVSRQMWLSVPLPIDLTPLGMTGCKLYGDQILAIPVATDAAGSIKLQVGVPSGPGWSGVHIVGQAIIADPGANPANLVASDAVEGIIR
jgi:hypothetical protein